MTIVFTDLDGSLLDADTYSWEPARPALDLLARQGVPWVMVSSKTRSEIEELREDIGHPHPFVVENGGAAYIPQGYFGFPVDNVVMRDGYEVLEWGTPYAQLVAGLREVSNEECCPVTGFHDMTIEEVAGITGLSHDAAAKAKQREYDEPFVIANQRRAGDLLNALLRAGLRWTHGGRFHHVCGNNDKSTAVRALLDLFRRQHGPVRSIALGDSLNDLPMMQAVDLPVLVKSRRRPSIHFRSIGARYTRSSGAKGWNEAILDLLSESAQPAHR